jgi:hypothetical protein
MAYLPYFRLFYLLRVSPSFCKASVSLPSCFWKSVAKSGIPWIKGYSLPQYRGDEELLFNYITFAA